METTTIVVLILAIPVVLFPAIFTWYLNIGAIIHAVRGVKAAREKKAEANESAIS
jgi:hypothetical protein